MRKESVKRCFGTAISAAILLSGCAGTVSQQSGGPTPQPTFSVSGMLTPVAGGGGATVALSGAKSAQVTADGSGNYSFGGLSNGQYTLTPSKAGFSFNPAVQSVAVNSADVSNVNFTASAVTDHSVALAWGASTSAVAGYNVYRSTVSGGSYTKLNSALVTTLAFTDTTVQSGTTYFYVTTAVDAAGSESVFSNEVQAIVP